MSGLSQLGYVGLSVSDLPSWRALGEDVLGFQANGQGDNGALFLRMDEYHHRFILHPSGADDIAYAGWEVPNKEQLDAFAERLLAGNVAVSRGSPAEVSQRRVKELIRFRDPLGLSHEVYYGPLIEFERPFHSPRPLAGFETGAMGLGHIVLWAESLQPGLQFYTQVMGLKVSDFIEWEVAPGRTTSAAFFHCNPRHHSLAIISRPNPPRLLHHLMVQLKDLNDVGTAMYLCQDRGVPITSSFGHHTNDHMTSFYLRTPSGFEIEYGWGARVIDDTTWSVAHHAAPSTWGHRRTPVQEPLSAETALRTEARS